MQFLGKFGKFVCWRPLGSWRPLLGEILDPPLDLYISLYFSFTSSTLSFMLQFFYGFIHFVVFFFHIKHPFVHVTLWSELDFAFVFFNNVDWRKSFTPTWHLWPIYFTSSWSKRWRNLVLRQSTFFLVAFQHAQGLKSRNQWVLI